MRPCKEAAILKVVARYRHQHKQGTGRRTAAALLGKVDVTLTQDTTDSITEEAQRVQAMPRGAERAAAALLERVQVLERQGGEVVDAWNVCINAGRALLAALEREKRANDSLAEAKKISGHASKKRRAAEHLLARAETEAERQLKNMTYITEAQSMLLTTLVKLNGELAIATLELKASIGLPLTARPRS